MHIIVTYKKKGFIVKIRKILETLHEEYKIYVIPV